ncbi:hypothetical protein [Pseudokordiimonas caeni]|uniref:hypothetical protein n=1 Tax=Pseudokordiimonas caeni TaxID=2997908 RepID=UPI002810BD5E|nr:hypothetical protein [Pseudokordiimonas caeni]
MRSPFPQLDIELSSKEKLIWSGQPDQGLKLRGQDAFLIPFSLIWLIVPVGILLSGEENVQNNTPFPFSIIPLIFLAVGAYLLFGRFLQDAWRRKRTVYGLTDKRAIIISRSGTKSVPIGPSLELNFKQHSDDFGTIQFGAAPSFLASANSGSLSFWSGAPPVPTFECVPEGANVYREIKRLMEL